MGIDDFTEPREYVYLMLLLMFLEDKAKEEQFLLSHITEFISSNPIGDKADWTNYYTRRSLIKVLRFAVKNRIIKIGFSKSIDTIPISTKAPGSSRLRCFALPRAFAEIGSVC